jgi:hypothetical protein
MQRILVDHARGKLAEKRGGGDVKLQLDEAGSRKRLFLRSESEQTNSLRWQRIPQVRFFMRSLLR